MNSNEESRPKTRINIVLFGLPTENDKFLSEMRFRDVKRLDSYDLSLKDLKKQEYNPTSQEEFTLKDKEFRLNLPLWGMPYPANLNQAYNDTILKKGASGKAKFIQLAGRDDPYIIPIKDEKDLEHILKEVEFIRTYHPKGNLAPIMLTSEFNISQENRDALTNNGITYLGSLQNKDQILQKLALFTGYVNKNELPDPKKVLSEIQYAISRLKDLEVQEKMSLKRNFVDKSSSAQAILDKLEMFKKKEQFRLDLISKYDGLDAYQEAEEASRVKQDVWDESQGEAPSLGQISDLQEQQRKILINIEDEIIKEIFPITSLLSQFQTVERTIKMIEAKGDKLTRVEHEAYIFFLQEKNPELEKSFALLKKKYPLTNIDSEATISRQTSLIDKIKEIFESILVTLKLTKSYIDDLSSAAIKSNFKQIKKENSAAIHSPSGSLSEERVENVKNTGHEALEDEKKDKTPMPRPG